MLLLKGVHVFRLQFEVKTLNGILDRIHKFMMGNRRYIDIVGNKIIVHAHGQSHESKKSKLASITYVLGMVYLSVNM